MREIVLDTETTGLDPKSGHRIVEIGCIELLHHAPTGKEFHAYINPERDMPQEAFNVHGLSEAFLSGHPVFADVADRFLTFIGEAQLVIHNAEFDMRFINAELERLGRPLLPMSRAVDTVAMARKRFPGAQVNLDALCSRFGVDNSSRSKHGALIDSELLAGVYIELLGGKQIGLALAGQSDAEIVAGPAGGAERPFRPPRPHAPSAGELEAHTALLDRLDNPIWRGV
ncbi:MAG: DNA polymerase III subunit epsilon [Alphaproteobacteria bacterium]|nr:DNA polymerase III subunit epsilon [Alphaproteobacteria bacterium]